MKSCLTHLTEFQEVLDTISAPADISVYVTSQNVAVKVYPPPPAEFKAPELPPPKLPDSPPVDLVRIKLIMQGFP